MLVGVALVAVGVVPLVLGLPHDRVSAEAALPLLAWPVLGVAGIVVLDRGTRTGVAWGCLAASALPSLLLCAWLGLRGTLLDGGVDGSGRLGEAATSVGPWALTPILLPAVAAWREPRAGRSERRWRAWITLVAVGTLALAGLGWWLGSATAYGIVAALGVGALAVVVVWSVTGPAPRPIDEPLVDITLVAGVGVAAAGAGLAVRWVALHEQIFAPDAIGALAAAATVAMLVPAARAVRSAFRQRRYGDGVLRPDDVAAITAGLGSGSDPRELLDRAAAMVAGASGVAEARIVLDDLEAPAGWCAVPLTIGPDVVGTLLLRPRKLGGLESCQERSVQQLVPTVALAARAVSSAVDAEHARRDAVRERQRERDRILADLHDDLGPVLAGMSMRVEAARAEHDLPELVTLAEELRACRADLRRIVADLTPTALESTTLPEAIDRLVASLGRGQRPTVEVGSVVDGVDGPAASMIYRLVAEGITNAVRHARASTVRVTVERGPSGVVATISDDGVGGPILPGTGLTSLRARAEALGGTLTIDAVAGRGTCLLVALPGTSGGLS